MPGTTAQEGQPIDRTLRVEVRGLVAMLRDWLRHREVFRASWTDGAQKPLVIYRPFLARCEVRDDPGVAGVIYVNSVRAWLADLADDSLDALDLRLHEAGWHGVAGENDLPGVHGVGANTMATRTRTTTNAERAEWAERIAARWDVVVLYG